MLGLVAELELELDLEAAAVEDAAERIVVGEVAKLLLGLLASLDVEQLGEPIQRLAVLVADDRDRQVDPDAASRRRA